MLNNTEIQPALTAEEWQARKRPQYYRTQPCIRLSNDGRELSLSEDGIENGEITDERSWVEINDPESRHALAALALHGQPFGFTREDLKALSRCADNAERWASARMYDSEDHDAHERTRTIIQRIAALLPPE